MKLNYYVIVSHSTSYYEFFIFIWEKTLHFSSKCFNYNMAVNFRPVPKLFWFLARWFFYRMFRKKQWLAVGFQSCSPLFLCYLSVHDLLGLARQWAGCPTRGQSRNTQKLTVSPSQTIPVQRCPLGLRLFCKE